MHKVVFFLFLCCLSLSVNATTPEKNWTFLFFENGNNNLDEDTENAIKNLEQVGSNEQINVVTQWASIAKNKVVRMLLQKSTNPNKVTSPVLQNLGSVDMGDYRSFEDFIQWGVQTFPARHYFIVISDHGMGWHDLKMTKRFGDISRDEVSGHVITTAQLGEAMRFAAGLIGHKVDVYASDACYMSMIEVANELAETAEIVAGSEEGEPVYGWPYAQVLQQWQAQPDLKARDLASILTKTYVDFYNEHTGGLEQVTYSAFDMAYLDEFNRVITKVGQDIAAADLAAREKAFRLAQNTTPFYDGDYRDLGEFLRFLLAASLVNETDLAEAIKVSEQFVYTNAVSSDFNNHAFGVAIWLPVNKAVYNLYIDPYKTLKFEQTSHWSEAINALLQANQA